MIINTQLSNAYVIYKAKYAVSQKQTNADAFNTESAVEVQPSPQPAESASSTAKVDGALADALTAMQKSAKDARIAQRTVINHNLVLASREQSAERKARFEAFAAGEAAKKNIAEPNTSLKWHDGKTLSLSEVKARTAGAVEITVGKDELLTLMEDIEKALANGECYLTAVIKLFGSQNHGIGYSYDTFCLDPYTGEIKHASPSGACYKGEGEYSDMVEIVHSERDEDAVWDLAYDFEQFLKLRVFGETDGMSQDEVEKAISEIKERQANKCTWRFDSRPTAPLN
jgi:hypothetical protein